jgi:nifR3 family TIM-barrel protein
VKETFWNKLPRPFIVLAPMADVTDAAYRKILTTRGRPDALWTEFVSADGLLHAGDTGRERLLMDLRFSETERPIIAQFFTADQKAMHEAAKLACAMGFDGIDINMGCPDRTIEKQKAGAALIKDPARARGVLRAAMEGAGDLPVSVKTRLGYNEDVLDTWLPELLAEKPAAVTIHARTRKEMSKVPARWARIARAVEIRDAVSPETLIIGNGDVVDIPDAQKKSAETGCEGVMLGRAIFANPWVFAKDADRPRDPKERFEAALEHTLVFREMFQGIKSFATMKKHYKAYINNFEGAAVIRGELMALMDFDEAIEALESLIRTYPTVSWRNVAE